MPRRRRYRDPEAQARRAQARRASEERSPIEPSPTCPKPTKRRYATENTALWRTRIYTATASNRIYLCPCGFYHATSKRRRKK